MFISDNPREKPSLARQNSSKQSMSRCKTSQGGKVTRNVTAPQLPVVPVKVTTKLNAPSTSHSDASKDDSIASDKRTEIDTCHSPTPLTRRFQRTLFSPQNNRSRLDTYTWEDPVVGRDQGYDTRDSIGRRVLKRCNTDLSLAVRTKPCVQRPCLPDSITHQMFNGQNNDYIRRTEVKVINNKKLIHMDYSPCHKRGKKLEQNILNSRGIKRDKSSVLKDRGNIIRTKAHNRTDLSEVETKSPLYQKLKNNNSSVGGITPLSSVSKHVSSKGTTHSELSSLLRESPVGNILPSISATGEHDIS